MAEAVGAELVGRMVALVRDIHADHLRYDLHDREQDFCKRTASIIAELPAPVDPDLLLAREVASEQGWADAVTRSLEPGLVALIKRVRAERGADV